MSAAVPTGGTTISNLPNATSLKDGDEVIIDREGKVYRTSKLVDTVNELSANLTDNGIMNFKTLGAKLLNNSSSIDFTLNSRTSSILILAQGGDIFLGYNNARYNILNNGYCSLTANGDNSYTLTNSSTSNGARYWTFIYEA